MNRMKKYITTLDKCYNNECYNDKKQGVGRFQQGSVYSFALIRKDDCLGHPEKNRRNIIHYGREDIISRNE